MADRAERACRRTLMLSVLACLAMGVLAVLAGYSVAQHGDLLATARACAASLMALAFVTLRSTLRRRR